MITRDPLQILVFQDKYWPAFDDSTSPIPLPKSTGMSAAEQVKAEDEYNRQPIACASQNLGLLGI